MKPVVKIENWRIVNFPDDASFLIGHVTNHPRFPPDYYIRTSKIVKMDLDFLIVETLNTVYELGKPYEVSP